MNKNYEKIVSLVCNTLVEAGSTFREDSPLCDDTGIPHIVLEIGPAAAVTGRMLDAIREGIAKGLRKLPGRPMGIMGDDCRRIDQSGGLNPDSAGVEPAPILIRRCQDNVIRLHILMFLLSEQKPIVYSISTICR